MTPIEERAVDIMLSPSKFGTLVFLAKNEQGLTLEALKDMIGLTLEALKDMIGYHPEILHYHMDELIDAGIVEKQGLCYRLTTFGLEVDRVVTAITVQSKSV